MATDIDFDGGLTCAMQCINLDEAIDWYEDILGFSLLYRVEDMGWCELESPVARVNLGLSQVENPEVKGGATLTFGVTNIDTARAALESRGVPFDGDTLVIPDLVKLATFFDPDGNKIMLAELMSKRA